jgi:hypothetical protein
MVQELLKYIKDVYGSQRQGCLKESKRNLMNLIEWIRFNKLISFNECLAALRFCRDSNKI